MINNNNNNNNNKLIHAENDSDFYKKLIDNDITICMFSGKHCSVCKIAEKWITKNNDVFDENISVMKCDMDNVTEDITKQFNITALPTFIALGKKTEMIPIKTLVGFRKKKFEEYIKSLPFDYKKLHESDIINNNSNDYLEKYNNDVDDCILMDDF